MFNTVKAVRENDNKSMLQLNYHSTQAIIRSAIRANMRDNKIILKRISNISSQNYKIKLDLVSKACCPPDPFSAKAIRYRQI